ncbi:MAG TPA: DUF4339 domain-containing protein [Bacteroidia bacterium]|jgi:hypothetical protein
MKKYYLHNGIEQQGPFDAEDLKSRTITRETPIWYDGLPDWTKAGDIPELQSLFVSSPPPFKTTTPPTYNSSTHYPALQEVIGIFTKLKPGETLEVENPSVSVINFEKGSFFKKYDTCIGKVYLTNQRILILKLIVLEAKNMKLESAEQFGSALGQWFDIPLEFINQVSTPKQGFFRSLFSSLIGEKKEGLEIAYGSPMEVEKKSLLFGTQKVRETFIIVFTIDNKDLWSMKVQTSVAKAK